MLDPTGHVTTWNPGVEKIKGAGGWDASRHSRSRAHRSRPRRARADAANATVPSHGHDAAGDRDGTHVRFRSSVRRDVTRTTGPRGCGRFAESHGPVRIPRLSIVVSVRPRSLVRLAYLRLRVGDPRYRTPRAPVARSLKVRCCLRFYSLSSSLHWSARSRRGHIAVAGDIIPVAASVSYCWFCSSCCFPAIACDGRAGSGMQRQGGTLRRGIATQAARSGGGADWAEAVEGLSCRRDLRDGRDHRAHGSRGEGDLRHPQMGTLARLRTTKEASTLVLDRPRPLEFVSPVYGCRRPRRRSGHSQTLLEPVDGSSPSPV